MSNDNQDVAALIIIVTFAAIGFIVANIWGVKL